MFNLVAADVRRMLRKREDTIPYVVALLSPDGKYYFFFI